MTSAIETNRFKARCTSKRAYTIIEKTKEIKEPRGRNEQTVITSQKTYFLESGEKVNKLNNTDFMVIKSKLVISKVEPFISKQLITDIKTLFDGLKNLALCFAMLLALPLLQTMLASVYDNRVFAVAAIWASLATIVLLAGYNFIWLYKTMEAKPKFQFLNKLSWLFIILITALIFLCTTAITYPKLIFSPIGSTSIIEILKNNAEQN